MINNKEVLKLKVIIIQIVSNISYQLFNVSIQETFLFSRAKCEQPRTMLQIKQNQMYELFSHKEVGYDDKFYIKPTMKEYTIHIYKKNIQSMLILANLGHL